METLRHPACTVGWVARLCRSWLSSWESNPNFPWEKSQWDHTVVKTKRKKLKEQTRQKLRRQSSWQSVMHAMLYSDPLQARTGGSFGLSPMEIFLSIPSLFMRGCGFFADSTRSNSLLFLVIKNRAKATFRVLDLQHVCENGVKQKNRIRLA